MALPIAPTQVVAGSAATTATSMAITVSQPSQLASLIVKFWVALNTSIISSISQTNVTWNSQQTSAPTNHDVEEWLGVPTGVPGTTVTLNFSAPLPATARALFIEWACKLTKQTSGTGTAGSPSSTQDTGSFTPTAGRVALISTAERSTGTFLSGPTGGFTDDGSSGSTTSKGAYLVVNPPGTTGSYQCTWSTTASVNWASIYVVYNVTPLVVNRRITQANVNRAGSRQPWSK